MKGRRQMFVLLNENSPCMVKEIVFLLYGVLHSLSINKVFENSACGVLFVLDEWMDIHCWRCHRATQTQPNPLCKWWEELDVFHDTKCPWSSVIEDTNHSQCDKCISFIHGHTNPCRKIKMASGILQSLNWLCVGFVSDLVICRLSEKLPYVINHQADSPLCVWLDFWSGDLQV